MRVATVDIGTNSVNLLVADVAGTGVVPLAQQSRIARLGQGVDAGGNLSPEAIERVVAVLRGYQVVAQGLGVGTLHCTATSAARDAANRAVFREALQSLGGVEVAIIGGNEEAWWSFQGALSGLGDLDGATVLDIGGGSTELIGGDRSELVFQRSLDVGSVRFTERYLDGQPPSVGARHALQQAIAQGLGALGTTTLPRSPLVGVAGTITSVAALEAGITDYDGARVDGLVVARERVAHWVEELSFMTGEAIVAMAPGVLRGREDVIFAGASILLGVMDHFGVGSIRVSDRGLRYGWALHVAQEVARGD